MTGCSPIWYHLKNAVICSKRITHIKIAVVCSTKRSPNFSHLKLTVICITGVISHFMVHGVLGVGFTAELASYS